MQGTRVLFGGVTLLILSGLGTPGAKAFYRPVESFGSALATGADFDGDGKRDFIVGCPQANNGHAQGSWVGRVIIVPGAPDKALRSIEGRSVGEKFGSAVAVIGDVSGDGVPDLAVGAPLANRPSKEAASKHDELAGRVTIYSGKDSRALRDLWGNAHDQFGSSLAVISDLDGDESPDLLVGAPLARLKAVHDAGAVRAFSGKSGVLLFESYGDQPGTRLGEALISIPDVNVDGSPDFAATGTGGAHGGEVRVCSGKDGTVLRVVKPREGWKWFGKAIASAPNSSPDGILRLAIAAPGTRGEGESLVGLVAVYSAKEGNLLKQVSGTKPGEQFGTAIACAGDLDGDGIPDLCIGAPGSASGSLLSAGKVCALSGAAGSLLWAIEGTTALGRLGSAVAWTPDVDGDSVADFIAGAPGAGELVVVSGRSGSVLRHVRGGDR
jgi:hypothetical protein